MNTPAHDLTIIDHVVTLLNLLHDRGIQIEQLLSVENPAQLLFLPDSRDVQTAFEILKFMDEIPGGFLIYRAEEGEQILYGNHGLLEILQCDTLQELRELTGNSFRGIVCPEDLDGVEESIEQQIAASHGKLDHVTYRLRRKDGAIRWVEDYGHFVRCGGRGLFFVFLADVTERRSSQMIQEAMRLSEKEEQAKKLQALIQEYDKERLLINQEHLRRLEVIEGLSANYASILYADLDRDSILPYRLSSRTKSQFEEKFQMRSFLWFSENYIQTWVHPEDQALMSAETSPSYIREKLSKSDAFYINYRAVEKGETLYLQLRIVNVSRTRQVSQVVMGYRRVDEELRRELEQKQILAEALDNANLAIVARNTFLSNMSHDMRTPLNAIFGYTALAKKNLQDPDTVQFYLDKVDASSQQLLTLIEHVLEISYAGSEESRTVESECNLCYIMEEIYEFLRPQAQEKSILFTLDCSGVKHGSVLCDQEKLRQFIMYLANNAVTYTPEGGSVSLRVLERAELPFQYSVYQFVISDTGIGISKEFLQKIFEPFSREKNTTLSGIHGIGLGLTIAKNIVELMGGTLEVQSVQGEGSTFTATLQLRLQGQAPEPAAAGCPSPWPAGRKLLLVEDNEINREIETELLEDLGFPVETAVNGRIAVDRVAASAPGDIGLILMDIQMPEMDGWQAARAIRALDDPQLANIPIIALSANVFDSDIRTSQECGINAHLPKPVDVTLLLKTIQEIAPAP